MIGHLTPAQLIAVIIVAALALSVVLLLAAEDFKRFERWKDRGDEKDDI